MNPNLPPLIWLAAGDTLPNPFIDNLPVLITGIFVLLAAIATAVATIFNRARDAKSRREPTVAEMWARLDTVEDKVDEERAARIAIETKYYALRNAFTGYVARVRNSAVGISVDLTDDERHALEDTHQHAGDDAY